MKKVIAAITAAVLLSVLVFPGTALAAKGGNEKVKNTPPGQVKKEAPAETGKLGKAEKPKKTDEGIDASDEEGTEGFKNKHREQVQSSEEGSETVEPRRTGIANALSRIEANLARAEAKVLAGTKKALPSGLVSVYEKFLSWLGLTPEEPAPDDETPPGDETSPDDETPPGDETSPDDETPPDDGAGEPN